MKEFTDSQEKALQDCMEIFAKITIKQGSIIPFDIFYGDGTRFPKLSRAGVASVYESAIELWKENGLIS